jgi:alpha-ketoglutarate-dependent 2,4-dichlorophenoxyacetate dioxygenase
MRSRLNDEISPSGKPAVSLTFHKLQPNFAAEVGAIDLRRVHDRPTLDEIRAGMDEFSVLVFRDQPFTDEEQLYRSLHP